jgi:large subunit ribosomal protein L31
MRGDAPPYVRCEVNCVTCGNHFVTRSTKPTITVDTCARCHPFYVGAATNRKTSTQVDRFNRRYSKP